MANRKVENIKDANLLAEEAMTALLQAVESVRQAGGETLEIMMAMKRPVSIETMKLSMLLQASMSFSVALQQWIDTVYSRKEELEELDKQFKQQGS